MEVFVDDNELARILKVPKSTVNLYARKKGLPHVKIGKHRRFNPDEVIKWLRKNGN